MKDRIVGKAPDIYCKKGKPLGALRLTCEVSFNEAADKSVATHGAKAERIYEAAKHLIQGLEHLLETQGHDLSDAYKVAIKAVQSRHGLNTAALQEVIHVATQHWPRGSELSDLRLGRAP